MQINVCDVHINIIYPMERDMGQAMVDLLSFVGHGTWGSPLSLSLVSNI